MAFNIKETLKNLDINEALNNVKEVLGLEPQETETGAYIPAQSALKLAAPKKSNYDNTEYETPYTGDKKILMVCTEQQYMTMANDKKFDTGNQPIEMMVPMLHFKKAGFAVDVFTATGKPVKIEQWAMPENDDKVKTLYAAYQDEFEQPNSLADFVANDMMDSDDYAAIFIPGGHGAMLGLPEDESLGELLRWGHNNNLFTLVICHGPAALLAANLEGTDAFDNPIKSCEDFVFKGYEIVAFPDMMDKQMPKLGYLPGEMPWYFGEKLEALGMTIINKLATGHTHQDKNLISGDGPLAANDFGKLSVNVLLKALKE